MAEGCRIRRTLYAAFEGYDAEKEVGGGSSSGNADAISQEGLIRNDLKG